MTKPNEWPSLRYDEWAPTKKTLQLCTQMLGKARLALEPPQPEWLNACLYLDARGFTTGAMPWGTSLVSMGIDVFDASLWIHTNDGRKRTVAIAGGRCIADIWADFVGATRELGIELDMWDKPQELPDVTPFSENCHDRTFVPEHAQRFLQVLSAIQGVFEEFRSDFFGRTGIQFWWGAFDLAVLLFSGKHAEAPEDRGYIMRYDLDAEHLNADFWVGDDSAPTPGFYAYITPRPDGCETASVDPEQAGWVESLGEWMLGYDEVIACEDPRQAILDFLRSVYQIAIDLGGWDELDHRYGPPVQTGRG